MWSINFNFLCRFSENWSPIQLLSKNPTQQIMNSISPWFVNDSKHSREVGVFQWIFFLSFEYYTSNCMLLPCRPISGHSHLLFSDHCKNIIRPILPWSFHFSSCLQNVTLCIHLSPSSLVSWIWIVKFNWSYECFTVICSAAFK